MRRRTDVEIGATVFEVKRNLRAGNVLAEPIGQLADYVRTRLEAMGARYVGVLTDSVEWRLYHLDDGQLAEVSSFTSTRAAWMSTGW